MVLRCINANEKDFQLFVVISTPHTQKMRNNSGFMSVPERIIFWKLFDDKLGNLPTVKLNHLTENLNLFSQILMLDISHH